MPLLLQAAQRLKISFEKIKSATNNFESEISRGGFGRVYKGKLHNDVSGQQTTVAVKRLDQLISEQGNREFLMEIQVLWFYKHKSLVSLVNFCDDDGEMILVYEYAEHGSLEKYLSDSNLSWEQRLRISLDIARGLNYLHNDVGTNQRVLHRDIKSSNILLVENWEARIADFGLAIIGPSNVEVTFVIVPACGTMGYVDPEYERTGILTKESDVYSFGVVLFEILCGRLAYIDIERYQDEPTTLTKWAAAHFEQNKLDEIIFPSLTTQIKKDALKVFSEVAYECLSEKRSERPNMGWIVEKLEKALKLQASTKGFIRIGTWGRSGSPPNQWSFELEKYHKLVKITIDHGDVIYSLMFTSEFRGVFYNSKKYGGWAGGETVSEVIFDVDEEITGITGSRDGFTIISSLSFQTNKRSHGPFGTATENVFSIPWDKGSLVGFYGVAGYYIDNFGIYVKANVEIIKVGTWGRTDPGGPQNIWYLRLEKNEHLKKITINHGDLIYSLNFTTQYRSGLPHTTYKKAGGWEGGETVSEVIFDLNEEIIAINGTIALSRGNDPSHTVISSISFVTNKKTHGPYGNVRGKPFKVTFDDGSFAGLYGSAGRYIDRIGVYLNTIL